MINNQLMYFFFQRSSSATPIPSHLRIANNKYRIANGKFRIAAIGSMRRD